MKMTTFVIASLLLVLNSHASESVSSKDAELKIESNKALVSLSSVLNIQIGKQPIVFRGIVESLSLSESGTAANLKGAVAEDLECTLYISDYQGPGVHVELSRKGSDEGSRKFVTSVRFEGSYEDEDNFTKSSAELSNGNVAISQLKMFKTSLDYRGGGTYKSKALTQITIAPIIDDRIEKVVFADYFRDSDFWNLIPIPVMSSSKDTGTCKDLKRINR
ncbi:hypothetical protein B9G69_012060 [Bdellovibrio sp. SKB1291214]|uniref:hypothetical protein n=1 Tax=Bdellovibrio sp. SKB1291214 TaxID=1732569 RepID=UPI000B5192DE|nr:hypothetical protein [Bdellovibrio sp. SKB1291214]UYL07781.1 hypothetical protein B9G69_012060 [Bdellovibrio sp. SKB1291214]